jgi:hypothetical protein
MKPSDKAMAESEQSTQNWWVWLRQRRKKAPRLMLVTMRCGCQLAVTVSGPVELVCPIHGDA